MQHDDFEDVATPLDTDHVPQTIVNRDDEQAAILDALSTAGSRNLYLYGPRGTGKTLVTRNCLNEAPSHLLTCYISCKKFDTEYEVLRQLYRTLTGNDINNGYHTAQLQERIEEHIAERKLVLVLDEIDFLFENNGDDLLYYLSRMKHHTNVTIVAISANHPEPQAVIEERTLSSLQPWYITFESYTREQIVHILETHLQDASLLDAVDQDALSLIADTTGNIQLALHWLEQAASTSEEQVTDELLRNVKSAAVQRYRDVLLTAFSSHHHLLFEAISQLVAEHGRSVNTGVVYDRYADLCDSTGNDPLSHRRITDFITHLELLNIIIVNHHTGGANGKTREIRIKSLL